MSTGPGAQGLSNDHIAMMVLGCVGLGVLYAKRGPVLASAGSWLRDHQILTDHNAILTIPHLGGLDLARLLMLAGLLVIAPIAVGIVARQRAGSGAGAPNRSSN